MRTTVEISDSQHQALNAIARGRGLRGFSLLVQEAIDAYLRDMSSEEVDLLLTLEGAITADDADEVQRRIDQARRKWRAS